MGASCSPIPAWLRSFSDACAGEDPTGAVDAKDECWRQPIDSRMSGRECVPHVEDTEADTELDTVSMVDNDTKQIPPRGRILSEVTSA